MLCQSYFISLGDGGDSSTESSSSDNTEIDSRDNLDVIQNNEFDEQNMLGNMYFIFDFVLELGFIHVTELESIHCAFYSKNNIQFLMCRLCKEGFSTLSSFR